ncbi:MAG: class I SAM-dependent methyltransferase, partial [Acidimicrobiia bacterium]
QGQVTHQAAEVYETFFVPGLFGQWPERVIDTTGIASGHRVLDVGCGTGVLARAAWRVVGKEGRVVGLDPNVGMLEVARRSPEPIEWVPGVAENLPFADGEFDHVVSQFAAMFFEDRARAVEEMARVAADDGRVTVVTWAEISQSPGYLAMASLLEELFGAATARAVTVPFTLGRPSEVRDLLAQALSDVRIEVLPGEASFESIEAWVHTEIRGWTLAGSIDDDQYDALLRACLTRMAPFTDTTGRVRFPAPALVGHGTPSRPGRT